MQQARIIDTHLQQFQTRHNNNAIKSENAPMASLGNVWFGRLVIYDQTVSLSPFLRVVGDAVVVERSKHLYAQNSVEEEEEEQEDGHTPDLFPRAPWDMRETTRGWSRLPSHPD